MAGRFEVVSRVIAEIVAEPVERAVERVVGALVKIGAVLITAVVVEVIDISRDEVDQGIPGQEEGEDKPRLGSEKGQNKEEEQALLDESPTVTDRASHIIKNPFPE
jgi:hypothetical protein